MRYHKLFKKLTLQKTGAFVPFITLGDPDFNQSLNIIDILIASGSDALELGIPFSDPIADGPSIQNSFQRAFKSKITQKNCFEIINIIRNKYKQIPIGLLTYANLVVRNKINIFYESCKNSGVDSILIADLPIGESLVFRNVANQHKISQIFICPPNADCKLLKRIAKYSQSYIYLVSRPGVTGNKSPFQKPSYDLVQQLKEYSSTPILQGFGISQPKHAKSALLSGVSGVISGSIISDIIKNNMHSEAILLKKLKNFVISMKNAMKIL